MSYAKILSNKLYFHCMLFETKLFTILINYVSEKAYCKKNVKFEYTITLKALSLFILDTTATLANSEDPGKMPHQGLHCLLR